MFSVTHLYVFPKDKILMKRSILFVLMIVVAELLSAAPAMRVKKVLTLSDGTSIEVILRGDEHLSYYCTMDGYLVEERADGYHVTDRKTPDPALRQSAATRSSSVSTAQMVPYGSPLIPVVLADFTDVNFTVGTVDAYKLLFNGKGDGSYYTGTSNTGSIKEYFADQSFGQFIPEFDILGTVTVSHEHDYYGNKIQSRRSTFRNEVVEQLSTLDVDWSKYDSNNDGKIDMLLVLFAGKGAQGLHGDNQKDMWACEFTSAYHYGDLTFSGSALVNELFDDGKLDGIGVMCHEISHAIGLPDMYDTNGTGGIGMDVWSLMDFGEYMDNGYSPVAYDAYERDFMGWLPLVDLSEPQTVRLKSIDNGGVGYRIVNPKNIDEYYVVELTGRSYWNRGLFKSAKNPGVQVTHVDYSPSAWSGNIVNTVRSHQRMCIIAANNYHKLLDNLTHNQLCEEWSGHLYPCRNNAKELGMLGNNSLTASSKPAASVFTGGTMDRDIYDIEFDEATETASFKFMPLGTLDAPAELSCQTLSATSARLTWSDVERAECYRLEYKVGEDSLVVDSIAGNTYVLSSLAEDVPVKCSVRAMAEKYRNSQPSQVCEFSVGTGITSLMAGEASTDDIITIYNIKGVAVARYRRGEAVSPDEIISALPHGIYIVGGRKVVR